MDLRRTFNAARRESLKTGSKMPLNTALETIAREYSKIDINRANPHAFKTMLAHLKNGVERPIDVDKFGKDRGVIEFIETRQRAEKVTTEKAAMKRAA